MKTIVFSVALLTCLLSACTTTLTSQAEKIAILEASQKVKCKRIKLINIQVKLGPNKAGNAINQALNESAEAGADSFYLISTSSHAFDGESVTGEALRCN